MLGARLLPGSPYLLRSKCVRGGNAVAIDVVNVALWLDRLDHGHSFVVVDEYRA